MWVFHHFHISTTLVRRRHDVLVAEGEGHGGDEQPEEQLQLPQAVLVQEQEGERVRHCRKRGRQSNVEKSSDVFIEYRH